MRQQKQHTNACNLVNASDDGTSSTLATQLGKMHESNMLAMLTRKIKGMLQCEGVQIHEAGHHFVGMQALPPITISPGMVVSPPPLAAAPDAIVEYARVVGWDQPEVKLFELILANIPNFTSSSCNLPRSDAATVLGS